MVFPSRKSWGGALALVALAVMFGLLLLRLPPFPPLRLRISFLLNERLRIPPRLSPPLLLLIAFFLLLLLFPCWGTVFWRTVLLLVQRLPSGLTLHRFPSVILNVVADLGLLLLVLELRPHPLGMLLGLEPGPGPLPPLFPFLLRLIFRGTLLLPLLLLPKISSRIRSVVLLPLRLLLARRVWLLGAPWCLPPLLCLQFRVPRGVLPFLVVFVSSLLLLRLLSRPISWCLTL